MKKISKLFAIAPLALAMVFGGMVYAAGSAPKQPEGDMNTVSTDKVSYKVKLFDATKATRDIVVEKDEAGKGDLDIELTEKGGTVADAVNAAKVYYSAENMEARVRKAAAYPDTTVGLKMVEAFAAKDSGEYVVYLGFTPAQKKIDVLHILADCEGVVKSDSKTFNQHLTVDYDLDLTKADKKTLESQKIFVIQKVDGEMWKPYTIAYSGKYNDSNVISYKDPVTGEKVEVRNLNKTGDIKLVYTLATCPAKKDDKKVDAASDEEKKEEPKSEEKPAEKTEEKKPMENKTLPATGSSSSVVLFLSAAVLLGSGLVLVKKH